MHGSVASAHPLSTAIGREILARGGNAYDAVIAVSAALTVVQPHMNGLGSDFFAVVHDDGFRSVSGSGGAGQEASSERLRALGHTRVPVSGPLASLTVPGLVAAWTLLSERTALPFAELIAPATRLAHEGFPASPSLARAARRTAARADDDWRRIYGGVRAGATLRQSELARTLSGIGGDRGHSFYHGDLARSIARDMERKGGLLRFADLDGYRADWTTPLTVRYRGYDVYVPPPNSQGATALIWLNLLSRVDLSAADESAYLGHLLRTLPTAYAYRARYIGDPVLLPFPADLLDPAYPYAAPSSVARSQGSGGGDTTAFSVFDGTIGVSAIQSNYMGFGSGQSVAGTGINLNNRGSYFTLDPGHHNALAPGKRPFHTLMAIIAKGPAAEILLGTMGGDVQPQTNVQVLTRLIDRGAGVQEAIAAPRFAVPASIYRSAVLYAEDGLAVPGARAVGRDRDLVGHAQAIRAGHSVEVGIDPRGDGLLDLAPRTGVARRRP